MSLYNDLNKLNIKIKSYTELLDNKTNELNSMNLLNENKLNQWNNCKKKLRSKLKKMDNNFNTFIKETNKCINNIKYIPNTSINTSNQFGTIENTPNSPNSQSQTRRRLFMDDDEENEENNSIQDDSDEDLYDSEDSDNYELNSSPDGPDGPNTTTPDININSDTNTQIIEIPETPETNPRTPITNKINKHDEYFYNVNEVESIDLKVYNSLLYSQFLNTTLQLDIGYRSAYEGSFEPSVFNTSLEKAKYNLDGMLAVFAEEGAVIAGGYINMANNYADFEQSLRSDVDIYVNKRSVSNVVKAMLEYCNIKASKYHVASAYNESFFKKNGLSCRITLYSTSAKFDILVIHDSIKLTDVIKNFDLTYCSVYYDAKDNKVKGKVDDMLRRSGKLNSDYVKQYVSNKFIQNRINKYKKRGYTTIIKGTIDYVVHPPLPNKIDDENVVALLLDELYNKYKRLIPLDEIALYFSLDKYTLTNITKLCKQLSEYLYKNPEYFRYIIISIVSDFKYNTLSKKVQRNLITHPNQYKGLKKLIDLLDDFEESITNDVLSDQSLSIYIMKPKNILLYLSRFANQSVITMLNTINSDLVISNEEIQKLNEIYSNDQSLSLNQILIKYNYDKRYINTAITIIDSTISMNEKLEDLWMCKERFSIATLDNISEFRDKISSVDISNHKEIMYYDLYEFEEKPFDELYEDDSYLLFILGDTNTGFSYTFDTLTTNDLQEFILECTQDVLSAPRPEQIKNINKWYNQLSTPYNVGLLTGQYYQALSLYENSGKKIRVFKLDNPDEFKHVSSVKAIMFPNGLNVWSDEIDLVSETHCGISMKVYNKISYMKIE